jgi:hypothetical protein
MYAPQTSTVGNHNLAIGLFPNVAHLSASLEAHPQKYPELMARASAAQGFVGEQTDLSR